MKVYAFYYSVYPDNDLDYDIEDFIVQICSSKEKALLRAEEHYNHMIKFINKDDNDFTFTWEILESELDKDIEYSSKENRYTVFKIESNIIKTSK